MTASKVYRRLARESLSGNWALLYIVFICGSILMFASAEVWLLTLISYIISLTARAVANVLALWAAEGKKLGFDDITQYYPKVVKLFFLSFRISAEIMLFSLLLIIPGIIKAYGYTMAYFVFKENPDKPNREILKKSREIMRGHKWRLFKLDMSFFLWFLFAIVIISILSFVIYEGYSGAYSGAEFEQGYAAVSQMIAFEFVIEIISFLYFTFVSLYIQLARAHFYIDITSVTPSADNIDITSVPIVDNEPMLAPNEPDYTATMFESAENLPVSNERIIETDDSSLLQGDFLITPTEQKPEDQNGY